MAFLDWASTSPEIRFTASKYDGPHCNPNAAYAENERGLLREAEVRIKQAIGVDGGHVLYFRCATEAIRWLHSEVLVRDEGSWWRHSPYEHDACQIGMTNELNEVVDAVDFYVHQWVNHITGEIFSLKEIKAQLPENVQLVVDATAGFGKAVLPRNLENIASVLFMSGHKIGCPELSFMWLDDELCEWLGATKDIRNQWGLHHGSLSVTSVLALADAVEWACDDLEQLSCIKNWLARYHQMFTELSNAGIDFKTICPTIKISAINAIRLNGINADALQQFLASRNIYIGVGGSACSAAHDYRVLVNGYGLTDDEAAEVIRVSFGPETTADDIKALVDGIKEYRRQFC